MHLDKIVVTGKTAQEKVREGVKKLADATVRTLGPYGENGILEKGLRITNDGISIAKEIQLDDEIEDLALRKAREASVKANEQAGDGSTTTILLTHEILKSVFAVRGKPTVEILRDLNKEKDEVIKTLKESATPVDTKEKLIDSATVSVEDRDLGTLIGEAQWDLGPEGILIPEESNSLTVSLERVSGIRIDNGLSTMIVTNRPDKDALEVKDLPTLLTTHTVDSIASLEELVQTLLRKGIRELAVVARAYTEIAIRQIGTLAQNGFQIYPINAPYVNQREVMKDLRAVLGGSFLDADSTDLTNIQISDLGHARGIFARRWDATFTGLDDENAKGRKEQRILELKDAKKASESDFEKKAIDTRIAQLTSGFGIIKVGAVSDTERKRLFDKIEDAANATRAALQEGTVKGAGIAFKEIAETLPDNKLLKQPLLSLNEYIRVNAPNDFVVEDWVRDPVKVLRIALEQAVSVAGDLATVGTAIHSKWVRKEKEEE